MAKVPPLVRASLVLVVEQQLGMAGPIATAPPCRWDDTALRAALFTLPSTALLRLGHTVPVNDFADDWVYTD
jgi:hypothetical protein